MNGPTLVEVISGERRGILPSMLRGCFRLLEPAYRFVINRRNRGFDAGQGVVQVGKPVVSVGNLTTGGTGKTPMIMWLLEQLTAEDYEVVLLSRGYSARRHSSAEPNDEAREIAARFPGLEHRQDPNRVAAAQQALKEVPLDLFLLDDGFQHRRLHRDLDIVLIDSTRPFGFGRLLPAGLLREPIASLSRAGAIILTRCEQATELDLQELEATIRKAVAAAGPPIFRASTSPVRFLDLAGQSFDCQAVRGRCIAFSAIGNPPAFEYQLRGLGLNPETHLVFPDHHEYSSQDVRMIVQTARSSGAEFAVCTQKDRVKIPNDCDVPVFSLEIELGLDRPVELMRLVTQAIADT